MENNVIDHYVRMFDLLEIEAKLELLAKLTDNIKNSFNNPQSNTDKNALLNALSGSWVDVNDQIIEDIYDARTLSDREIELD